MPVLPAAAPCPAAVVTLRAGGDAGDFNGMSHSGTYLTIGNHGRRTCTVPGLPVVVLRDRAGRALPIVRRAPVGMHPGPVVVPVRVAAGASVRTGIRWVSGAVYDRSRCYDVASVAVTIGGRRLTAPLAAHVCGESGKAATFDQAVLAAR